MEEGTHRFWDITVKAVGLLALLASGWWTYYKYREDRRVEINSLIFQKQTEIYFEVSRLAGAIAYSRDEPELDIAKEKFHELDFGGLAIVEDARVSVAAHAFHTCFEKTDTKPCERYPITEFGKPVAQKSYGFQTYRETQQQSALDLSNCIREALEKDRGIKFGEGPQCNCSCPYD